MVATSSIVTTVLITTVVSSVITIIVKAVWEWASNKNGKKELDGIKSDLNDQLRVFKEQIKTDKIEIRQELNDRLTVLEDIKKEIINQTREYNQLKQLILLEYVRKVDFDKYCELISDLRDMVIINKNEIANIKKQCENNCKLLDK